MLDKSYFKIVKENKRNSLDKCLKSLKDGELSYEKSIIIKVHCLNTFYNYCIASYSYKNRLPDQCKLLLNKVIDEITSLDKEDVIQIATKGRGTKKIRYDHFWFDDTLVFMNILSISILMEDESSRKKLGAFFQKMNINDNLLNFFVNQEFIALKEGESPFDFREKKFGKLKEHLRVSTQEELEDFLKIYLEKNWYQNLKGTGSYNLHKQAPEHPTFPGYWAFEVAAVVKIKGLDDSSFRDHKYYPDRLV